MDISPQLDPDPRNELGRGLIDTEVEAWLLSRGTVFAMRLPGGHTIGSCRPIAQAVREANEDAYRRLLPLRAQRAMQAAAEAESVPQPA